MTPPGEAFAAAGARLLAEAIRAAADEADSDGPGTISLALAGGSTPRPVYRRLSEARVPWEAVEIYFGDERCVPPSDAASNYRMAREAILDRIPIPEERVHRMVCESGDAAGGARAYDRILPEPLDVVVLGIGADGHTASLFPKAPSLAEPTRRVVPARAPGDGSARLTVTPRVLHRARRVLVLATGRAKSRAVRRALEEPYDPALCPAQLVRSGTWILDRDAASALRPSPEGAAATDGETR